uniref:Uncharacterized protein n=1 Tax=viral metagenome TaxID=1070528 RepID=A0A6C0CS36_9ZZZZ
MTKLLFTNKATDKNTYVDVGKYTHGAGVGAKSRHVRSVLKRKATLTSYPEEIIFKLSQFGYEVYATRKDAFGGHSVAISEDGQIIALGARIDEGVDSSGNPINNGAVFAFEYRTPSAAEWSGTASNNPIIGKGDDDGKSYGAAGAAFKKYWVQLGNRYDMQGTVSSTGVGSEFGAVIDMTDDGSMIAVGAPRSHILDASGVQQQNAGKVYYYKYNTTTKRWDKQSTIIEGDGAGEYEGYDIKLTGDGDTIIVGAVLAENPSFITTGRVRVYTYRQVSAAEWSGAAANPTIQKGDDAGSFYSSVVNKKFWVQKGADLFGTLNSQFGFSVALTNDGNTIIIGAPNHDSSTGKTDIGRVVIYNWSGATWVQKAEIEENGLYKEINLGREVAINHDGSIIAVTGYLEQPGVTPTFSTPAPKTFPAEGQGAVIMYEYKRHNGQRSNMQIIYGDNKGDNFGSAISFSKNNQVVIGAPQWWSSGSVGSGYAKIYKKEDGVWQEPDEIDGVSSDDSFGHAVAISGRGNRVIIGARFRDYTDPLGISSGTQQGSATVYNVVPLIKKNKP